MLSDDRIRLHYMVFAKIGGKLFASSDSVKTLPLGPDYTFRMSKFNELRTGIFKRVRDDLAKYNDSAIVENFSQDGSPITDKSVSWLAAYRKEVKQSFGHLTTWFLTPLFQTGDLADFEYWGRAEFLSLDEIVWLSVGLEPKEGFIAAIKPYNARGNNQERDAIAHYMSRHRETIRRKFDPHDMKRRPDLILLREWIEAVKLDVHPEFLAILPDPSSQHGQEATTQTSTKDSEQLDSREKASMAKLIAAMAIDCYGYDPKAKRSNIPNEIEGIANRLGLELSSGTIRKYLKKGAELIPEDWEPE